MKKIGLLLSFVLAFSCSDIKKKDCESFNLLKPSTKISKIILLEQKQEIKRISNQKEIDSILLNLKSSCSILLKFSSKRTMNFYEQDSLVFSIFINDDYFKHKGKTYQFEKNAKE